MTIPIKRTKIIDWTRNKDSNPNQGIGIELWILEQKSRNGDTHLLEIKDEKIGFSLENAAENIIRGGYQSCSDTMLGNMASMDIEREREKLGKTIVLLYWW